jgi:hypothetical protein
MQTIPSASKAPGPSSLGMRAVSVLVGGRQEKSLTADFASIRAPSPLAGEGVAA